MRNKIAFIDILYFLVLAIFKLLSFLIIELQEFIFLSVNLLFTAYVIIKIKPLIKNKLSLLNPLFLASVKMFILSYGITILYIYFEGNSIEYYFGFQNPFGYLINAIIYASIAFLVTIVSFNSKKSIMISNNFIRWIGESSFFLRRRLDINYVILLFIFVISLLAKLFLISVGVYGVLGTLNTNNVEIPFISLITILSSASTGVLFIMALKYFSRQKSNGYLLFFLFGVELFFSILSGFKGAIVIVVLVLALAYYIELGRIRFKYLIYTSLAIGFAYAVITPYRYFIQKDALQFTSISEILDGFSVSIDIVEGANNDDQFALIRRFNFLPEMVKFQEYKQEKGLSESDPDFIFITLTTPFQLIVPRFLWSSKPKADLGQIWVTRKVFEKEHNASTAFGPLGFLYMTGGIFAIIPGFWLIGLFLRFTNQIMYSGKYGGLIVALFLIPNLISLEAQFNFYIVGFIHSLIAALFFQRLILRA